MCTTDLKADVGHSRADLSKPLPRVLVKEAVAYVERSSAPHLFNIREEEPTVAIILSATVHLL